MDIVSRLKEYMEYCQIAISQFADTCNIPRPTISQILNGRNKKISDELISKIHVAFPDLSIVWLMFGEGDMLVDSNIKTSGAKNDKQLTFDDSQVSEHEIFSAHHDPFASISDLYLKKIESEITHNPLNSNSDTSSKNHSENNIADVISGKIESSKKITSIVVFYADNTFQTFSPS